MDWFAVLDRGAWPAAAVVVLTVLEENPFCVL